MSEPESPSASCTRCNTASALHKVRAEVLCGDCFTNYITTKIIKRMEGYKVRSASTPVHRILLPVSFGPSSLTLLHVLDHQLQGQIQKTTRVGYELHVLHIDDPTANDSSRIAAGWDLLQNLYPRHTYHRLPISSAISLFQPVSLSALLSLSPSPTLAPSRPASPLILPSPLTIPSLLAALPSPTSRTDLLLSLHRRLLAHTARSLSCASIALGHTATRLAELVLSETSKGRGAALSLLVGEDAALEGVRCVFPARELMRGEIERWVREVKTGIGEMSAEMERGRGEKEGKVVSGRDTTIEQLMRKYFAGVEVNYPSIVANVVRTTARLRVAEGEDGDRACEVCALPVQEGFAGLNGWGGDQVVIKGRDEEEGEVEPRSTLCYGCARSVEGKKGNLNIG